MTNGRGRMPAPDEPALKGSPDRGAWTWVPSLYFLQGLPYVVVMSLSVLLYKNLGLSNT
jgi:PAT family beta-lactamase induction signal transducer AmpG